jgi:hypothetical protein
MQTGDGRHVGTAVQAIHRAQMLFYFFGRVWPDGDVDTNVTTSGKTYKTSFTTSNGRVTPYAVVTPPGYDDAGNASKTYPVVYLMHGYGMKPEDLAGVSIVASAAMVNENVPPERRMQKMIIVYVDAVCRPGGDVNDPNGAHPLTGDLCEEGAFYVDHPDGLYQGEQMLSELQAKIEKDYRARPPGDVDVIQ